ncbi:MULTISPECIES: TetR/AcrR family transcriptional regulator [Paenibacillus]|uniref:HTH-type transcriptional regulator PksA n=1 Tax=Paenibacillus albilobatus TaxID=2716884 RepID=A0A920CFV2_9BACL|nr:MULTISPECIES: TetR family transcriptional regulator C-terminal domain-containing protein [Paenibacillus]GIO35052.1 HTH-type transcriptional regulator PksA [Paenibacillus albilobatus]
MPKIVDHEKQRKKVAEATWRVIQKMGLDQASVRNVADEAGLSVGSMRHYFTTHSELLSYAMKMVSDRVGNRITNIAFSGDLLTDIPLLVDEILPTDEEKRLEMEVWFAFVVKSLSDKDLAKHRMEVDDELRTVFIKIMNGLTTANLALPDLDIEVEIERFYALIDGLAVHAVLRPEKVTTDIMRRAVRKHLLSICRPAPASG